MSHKSYSFLIVLLLLVSLSARISAETFDIAGVNSVSATLETTVENHSAQRRGVGVVMSGGGAKGLYHIGVLEALEANGVPIDYVAGTSMGSIIAALYAAGYSPAEMRQIVNSGAVREWVSGRLDPSRYMAYYRQFDQSPAFINVRLDFGRKSGKRFLPTNLISSTQIDMALLELLAPATAASAGNFNRLMVPFFCVASDINTRRPVVLRRGELSEAVRASMAIPLVFKPVKLDSLLLYDGGIYDNFPWKPLDKAFSPALIIGSICTENTPPSEKNSLLDQAFLLAMQETDYSLPEGRGVPIARVVEANMLDFDHAASIMDMGYADAMVALPQILKRLGDHRCSAEQYAARRKAFRAKCPPLIFDDYRIEGLNEAQTEYVRDFVEVDWRNTEQQQVMDFSELRENLYKLLAGGEFTMDFPHITYNPQRGRYAFDAKFQTKPKFKISVGGSVSSTAFNMAYIGAEYSTIGRVAHRVGADLFLGPLYTWGHLSGRTDFYVRKPLFLDYSFNFSVRNLYHGHFGNVTTVTNTQQIKESEIFGSVGFGLPITHRSLFMLRANAGLVNYHYDTPAPEIDKTDHSRFSFFGLKAVIRRNTLDKPLYPRKGSDLSLSAIFITGRERFSPYDSSDFTAHVSHRWLGARFGWSKYFDIPTCSWFSFGYNIDAVITNHPRFMRSGATLLSLPAYTPTAHSRMIYMPEFRASRFVAGGVMPTFDLLHNLFFRTGFYAMYREKRDYVSYSANANFDTKERSMHYIVDASLVYHTPIGPVSLGLTKYNLHNWKNMYLMFNFGYTLFSPKGTFY